MTIHGPAAMVDAFAKRYRVVACDVHAPDALPAGAEFPSVDLTSDDTPLLNRHLRSL